MDEGERIKQARTKLGLSQDEFGHLAGIGGKHGAKSAVSQWERGVTTPSGDSLLNLRRTVNLNNEWVRTGKGDMFLPSPTAHPAEQAAAASGVDSRIAKLLARATPKSRGALERIAAAAAAGKLTEADLELLEQIAKRFEAK